VRTVSNNASDYYGKIKNSSVQKVEAPKQSTLPKKGKVKTGTDLRTGKK
jgi:hypothetical protein